MVEYRGKEARGAKAGFWMARLEMMVEQRTGWQASVDEYRSDVVNGRTKRAASLE